RTSTLQKDLYLVDRLSIANSELRYPAHGRARAASSPLSHKMTHPPAPFLDMNGVEVIYNHVILVLKGVSLTVQKGQIVALLGSNGAGKTTTLRAISNLLPGERGAVTKGSITLDGQRVDNCTAAEMVHRGVVQVME